MVQIGTRRVGAAFAQDSAAPTQWLDEGSEWRIIQASAAEATEVRLTSGDDTFSDEKGRFSVHVLGLAGDDDIAGRAGNDILSGGSGDDALGGGIGADLIFGGAGRDELLGGPGPDRISAGTGGDVIEAGGGADVIVGGAGGDSINLGERLGGALDPDRARDRVVYTDVSDSTADQSDRLTFFDPSRDVIDLRRIDADTTTPGNQAFRFIGSAAFSGTPGEVSFHPANGTPGSAGLIEADVDGDGQADLVIQVKTYQDPSILLTEDNFKL